MTHSPRLSLIQAAIDLRYRLFAARLRRVIPKSNHPITNTHAAYHFATPPNQFKHLP
jgi:hypothetical protein